jgi:hypothetical protein
METKRNVRMLHVYSTTSSAAPEEKKNTAADHTQEQRNKTTQQRGPHTRTEQRNKTTQQGFNRYGADLLHVLSHHLGVLLGHFSKPGTPIRKWRMHVGREVVHEWCLEVVH